MTNATKSTEHDEPRIIAASFVAAATDVKGLPAPSLPEVAFAGRSNVGKSSLLNALMQRRNLVRTSRTPGCTRQVNVFHAQWADRWEAHLVDLPGYGYAKRSRAEKSSWGPMLEGYLTNREALGAVVILVDVRRGPEPDDIELVEFLSIEAKDLRIVPVATKLDKLPRAQHKPAVARIAKDFDRPVIGFSSVTGDGRSRLWGTIRNSVSPGEAAAE